MCNILLLILRSLPIYVPFNSLIVTGTGLFFFINRPFNVITRYYGFTRHVPLQRGSTIHFFSVKTLLS
jgi:hypothetical protein